MVVSGFRMLAACGECASVWPKLYRELSKHDVKLAGMLEVLRVHDSEGRLGAILGSYEELFPMKAGKEIHQLKLNALYVSLTSTGVTGPETLPSSLSVDSIRSILNGIDKMITAIKWDS